MSLRRTHFLRAMGIFVASSMVFSTGYRYAAGAEGMLDENLISSKLEEMGDVADELEKHTVIYLSGEAGNDKNSGLTQEDAVETFKKARKLAGEEGIIYICGTIEVNDGRTWELPDGVVIRRAEGFKEPLVRVSGSLILKNILMFEDDIELVGAGTVEGAVERQIVYVPEKIELEEPIALSEIYLNHFYGYNDGDFVWEDETFVPAEYETICDIWYYPYGYTEADAKDITNEDDNYMEDANVKQSEKSDGDANKQKDSKAENVKDKRQEIVSSKIGELKDSNLTNLKAADFSIDKFGEFWQAWLADEDGNVSEEIRWEDVEGWDEQKEAVLRQVKVVVDSLKIEEENPDVTPEITPEVSPEVTPGTAPTPVPQPTQAVTPEPTEEPSVGPTPDATPEPTGEPSASPEPTVEPSVSPTPDASPEPTGEPSVSPTPDATPEPSVSPTPDATPGPTEEPSVSPTPDVSPEPTGEPSVSPTPDASPEPTVEPSATPMPDATPGIVPDATPTPSVTPEPTAEPTPEVTPEVPVLTEEQLQEVEEVKNLLDYLPNEIKEQESAEAVIDVTRCYEALNEEQKALLSQSYVEKLISAQEAAKKVFRSTNNVTIEGDFPWYVQLQVAILSDPDTSALENSGIDTIITPYDICLYDLMEDSEYDLNGQEVKVTVPAPDKKLYENLLIIHYEEDGNVEYIKPTYNEDGTISFMTDSFSPYSVAGNTVLVGNTDKLYDTEEDSNKDNPDKNNSDKNNSDKNNPDKNNSDKNNANNSDKDDASEDTRVPNTGDESPIIMYIVIIGVAVFVMIIAMLQMKKKK